MTNGKEPLDLHFGERMRLIRFRMKREHLRFAEEIRLIPRAVFWVAIVLFVLAQIIAQLVRIANGGTPLWPELSTRANALGVAGIVALVSIPVAAVLFLIAYVNRDAARRGMNAALWTFIVILLLPAWAVTGFLIYFLLREPLPFDCPQCGKTVSAKFNFCPNCKYNLRPTCPQCKHEVGADDRFCPHCAYQLAA